MSRGDARAICGVMLVFGLVGAPAPAAAAGACPRAVFFDLGNTLVESGPGGLFALRAGAQQSVDQLQARGVKLGVITNVPDAWTLATLEAQLAHPEFLDEFDVVVLAKPNSVVSPSKPNPLVYQFAYTQIAIPAPISETAFVGETLSEIANAQTNPTTGARATGMIGIHLSDAAPSPLADFTIPFNGLTQVPVLVDSLCPIFRDGFD